MGRVTRTACIHPDAPSVPLTAEGVVCKMSFRDLILVADCRVPWISGSPAPNAWAVANNNLSTFLTGRVLNETKVSDRINNRAGDYESWPKSHVSRFGIFRGSRLNRLKNTSVLWNKIIWSCFEIRIYHDCEISCEAYREMWFSKLEITCLKTDEFYDKKKFKSNLLIQHFAIVFPSNWSLSFLIFVSSFGNGILSLEWLKIFGKLVGRKVSKILNVFIFSFCYCSNGGV